MIDLKFVFACVCDYKCRGVRVCARAYGSLFEYGCLCVRVCVFVCAYGSLFEHMCLCMSVRVCVT